MITDEELETRLKQLGYDANKKMELLRQSKHYKRVLEEINDVNKLQLFGQGGLYMSEAFLAMCANDWVIMTGNQMKIVRYSFGSCDIWTLPYRNIVSYKTCSSSVLYIQVAGDNKRYKIGIFSQADKAAKVISDALE